MGVAKAGAASGGDPFRSPRWLVGAGAASLHDGLLRLGRRLARAADHPGALLM